MKKKIVIRFLEIIILIFILTGCDSTDTETFVYQETIESNYFKTLSIERYGNSIDQCGRIVYDTRTGVEYWLSDGTYNSGSLTLLVDKDGKPLIYTESEVMNETDN